MKEMKREVVDNTNYVAELEKYAEGLRILYVEDEDDIRETVRDILELYFEEVIVAPNGKVGLEKYLDFNPDIVLSDIQMPEMDGLEMVIKIKESNKNQAIVMCSGYDTKETIKELISKNITSFIVKPINLNKVAKILSKRCKLLKQQKQRS